MWKGPTATTCKRHSGGKTQQIQFREPTTTAITQKLDKCKDFDTGFIKTKYLIDR